MDYSFLDFLQLIGSLGIFIYGMKIMSEGIQKSAGNNLRKILKGMTKNRLSGIFTGFLTTVAIQSSSASTVMVISFVNAGLLTLTESFGVIMGANIGTTVTIWMVSLLGFKVKIQSIAIMGIGIAFPFLFAKKENLKNIAETIIGFGILFIGLEFLKESVPNIKENPEMLEFLTLFTDYGFGTTLIFVLIGTLLTIVVQSSSASTTITLIMVAQGWITFPIAAAMILGENIGTTVTANLAAMVGNVHAKRAARFHFLFNVIGVTWMLAVFPFFLQGIDFLMFHATEDHISLMEVGSDSALIGLSLFHSLFNILNVILLFAFVPMLERFIVKYVSSVSREDEEFRLKYISTGLMATTELSLSEARKEIQLFGKIIEKMSFSFMALLFEKHKDPAKIIAKIKKREEITDNIEVEIANYLTKVSEADLSYSASKRVRGMLSMINDLERIGDIFYQMTRNYERLKEFKVVLPDDALVELKDILDTLYKAIRLMRDNLALDNEDVNLDEAYELENSINRKRNKIRDSHFKRLEKGIYDAQSGVIFFDFINRIEKIGDHVINVNEAIVGLK